MRRDKQKDRRGRRHERTGEPKKMTEKRRSLMRGL